MSSSESTPRFKEATRPRDDWPPEQPGYEVMFIVRFGKTETAYYCKAEEVEYLLPLFPTEKMDFVEASLARGMRFERLIEELMRAQRKGT